MRNGCTAPITASKGKKIRLRPYLYPNDSKMQEINRKWPHGQSPNWETFGSIGKVGITVHALCLMPEKGSTSVPIASLNSSILRSQSWSNSANSSKARRVVPLTLTTLRFMTIPRSEPRRTGFLHHHLGVDIINDSWHFQCLCLLFLDWYGINQREALLSSINYRSDFVTRSVLWPSHESC
jgi:hypothetical protein